MRILLSSPGITAGQKQGLLRAAWAMLYAHYEGFCKNTLSVFFNVISESGIACLDLPYTTKLFALRDDLRHMKNMTNENLLDKIVNFRLCNLSKRPEFPDVDTQSNPTTLLATHHQVLVIVSADAKDMRDGYGPGSRQSDQAEF